MTHRTASGLVALAGVIICGACYIAAPSPVVYTCLAVSCLGLGVVVGSRLPTRYPPSHRRAPADTRRK